MIKYVLVASAALIVVLVGLYLYSASKIEVRGVIFNSLESVSSTGFILGGTIAVQNGGLLPVGVDRVEYSIVLEESGNELASGIIRRRDCIC